MKFKTLLLSTILLGLSISTFAQKEQNPNPFDFGKMWTFENPPKEWFKEAYDFDPGDEWFNDVRKSSLRFATWCSASFVSADGLIMTNHHCSRDVVSELQKEGENFDKQGFYARTLAEERKAEGLFVEQLIQVADITDLVKSKTANAENQAQKGELVQAALEEIKSTYAEKTDWTGLRMQTVTYYSGGKFSLYGYKKYDDIRLVLIPELDLGFYGGDPDNFTYPRYNLDATFWRAYDTDGNPMNTSENYFKFKEAGAEEGEPVFVVGNPGSTERYRTVAQLEYDRDYRFPMTYKFLKNRNDVMVAEYEELIKDPTKEFEAQALLNTIANVANGMKAYGGIVGGLNNSALFQRKVEMENHIRSNSEGVTYWEDLKSEYTMMTPHGWASTHLSPSGLRGNVRLMLHQMHTYIDMLTGNDATDIQLEEQRNKVKDYTSKISSAKDKAAFKLWLTEIQEDIYPGDQTLTKLLDGKSIDTYITEFYDKTRFTDMAKAEKCLKRGKNFLKEKDPAIKAAKLIGNRYKEAVGVLRESTPRRKDLESKIANQAFKVYGTSLPPDATFTLRISDGVIKAYDYNGTSAPPVTTYFGLYDRHYSHGEVFPWTLPQRWLDNPPLELMKSPLNTLSLIHI